MISQDGNQVGTLIVSLLDQGFAWLCLLFHEFPLSGF